MPACRVTTGRFSWQLYAIPVISDQGQRSILHATLGAKKGEKREMRNIACSSRLRLDLCKTVSTSLVDMVRAVTATALIIAVNNQVHTPRNLTQHQLVFLSKATYNP